MARPAAETATKDTTQKRAHKLNRSKLVTASDRGNLQPSMRRIHSDLRAVLLGVTMGLGAGAGAGAGCFSTDTKQSGTGDTDGAGTDGSGTATTGPGPNCGNGVVDANEECDLASANSDNGPCSTSCLLGACGDGLLLLGEEDCDDGDESATCNADCTPANCGDGMLNTAAGEGCDDGDNGPGKACRENCQPNVCGDNDIGPEEECDNGTENGDGQLCTAGCTVNICGDGSVGPDEGCDDGNTVGSDGCSANCELESCGDGVMDPGEECDDGKNGEPDDGCTDLCKGPACGDGFPQPSTGEECDDGADNGNSKGCTSTCGLATCGDGFVWADNEECDDGNQTPGDSCTNECTLPTCGDAIVQPQMGEECDEGAANANNAACKADCSTQKCGDGFVGPGEACDDGNTDPDDGCTDRCQRPGCGDGIVQSDEECDDSGISPNCDPDCTFAICGDNTLNGMAGEQCDDGNTSPGDGCHGDCTVYKGLFTTRDPFDGNLGGLAGADGRCYEMAQEAGLPGVYKAWLSTKSISAASRLTQAVITCRMVDGQRLALAWGDLTDGSLDTAPTIDQFGTEIPNSGSNEPCGTVWTHTTPTGAIADGIGGAGGSPPACANWTAFGQNLTGGVGFHTETNEMWTYTGCAQPCSVPMRLYCIEQ